MQIAMDAAKFSADEANGLRRAMATFRKVGTIQNYEELMVERSSSAEALGRAELWSNYRRIYARGQLRDGNVPEAYALAARHFLSSGSDYADLEWLAGFIALRFLKDPELALWHFERFGEAVETPISLGRAGYWLGRAYTDQSRDGGTWRCRSGRW